MKIKSGIFKIMGAEIGGVNPLPNFRKRGVNKDKYEEGFPEHLTVGLGQVRPVLPYLMQDRYNRERKLLSLKSLTLENEFLKVIVLPELGGRIHSIYDKVLKRELLFANPIIQPGNLAIRNAWLSGGIEWNFGSIGHAVTTCDNVFCAVLKDDEGNEFIRIYEFERIKISAARAAIRLRYTDYLEKFFSEEHYDIREGEVSLTDIWFEFCALKMAKERGIENPDRETIEELIDEAWDLYPPDKSIDFRMSDNKKNRYRISE